MKNLVTEVSPGEAWDSLKADRNAVLVDVRTKEEWMFTGIPDLAGMNKNSVLLEWKRLPGMAVNEEFFRELLAQFEGTAPSKIYFLCRSGVRSMQAAHTTALAFSANGQTVDCVNVAEGFEGDLDADGHRGNKNGWKMRGLPWRQS